MIGKKAKLDELLAEESILIKEQMGENEAEKLNFHQEIAKTKARSIIYQRLVVNGKWLKIGQFDVEAPSIIGRSKYGENMGY